METLPDWGATSLVAAAIAGVLAVVGTVGQIFNWRWPWRAKNKPLNDIAAVARELSAIDSRIVSLDSRVTKIDGHGGALDQIRLDAKQLHATSDRLHQRMAEGFHRVQQSLEVQLSEINSTAIEVEKQSVVVKELLKQWTQTATYAPAEADRRT